MTRARNKCRRILYVQFTNPAGYPPLEHSSRLLANAGWEILFLGISAHKDSLTLPPDPRVTVRLYPDVAPGLRQKMGYVLFCLRVLAWCIAWRPDWVYASDLYACPPALLSLFLGIPVLYHEHDEPSTENMTLFLRLCLAARRTCARRAKLCVIPNQARAEQFQKHNRVSGPIKIVWNCPLREEALAKPRQPIGGGLRLLYQGTIVPARLPLSVLHALAQLPDDITLTIAGYETIGSIGYVRTLLDCAAGLGIADRVTFIGALNRKGILSACLESDVGLALLPLSSDDINERHMAGASNKVFDYLACGAPALVPDSPEWREGFVESGVGVACDPSNPCHIAGAIEQFYSDPAKTRAMGERGRLRIGSSWNYESQFQSVLSFLNQ